DLTIDSIPPKDHRIQVKSVCNMSQGGESRDATHEVCQENIDLFEKISSVCNLNIIGIDVMCESLAKPIVTQSRSGILEINASPGLSIHEMASDEPINIAEKIFEMTIKKIELLHGHV